MEEICGGGDQLMAGAQEERRMKMKMKMKMKVMVAIDDSDGSLYALKWALHNLLTTMAATTPQHENEGLMVFLVNVQPKFHNYVYPVGSAGAAYYPASAVVESVKKAQEERSSALLSRALKMCNDNLVKAESIPLNGDPREMICQAAEQMDVNLLILGSRGLGKLKRAFLGSVSDYCAHHAKVPILIVKPPQEEHSKKH